MRDVTDRQSQRLGTGGVGSRSWAEKEDRWLRAPASEAAEGRLGVARANELALAGIAR